MERDTGQKRRVIEGSSTQSRRRMMGGEIRLDTGTSGTSLAATTPENDSPSFVAQRKATGYLNEKFGKRLLPLTT